MPALTAKSGFTIIVAYGLVAASIFAVQAVPLTGVFLLFLAAPLWINVLIHLMMANLAIFAIIHFIPRAWLLLPITYYAGGVALHFISLNRAHEIAADIERRNAAVTIRAEQPFSFFSGGDANAFELLTHYRVDRGFIRNGDEITTQYYARGEACDKANRDFYYERRKEPFLVRADLFPAYAGADKTRQCIIQQNEVLGRWRYRIISASTREDNFLNARSVGRSTVVDDRTGETLVTVETAVIHAFPRVPIVFAGCTPKSAAPKMGCEVSLLHSSELIIAGYKQAPRKPGVILPPDPETTRAAALARALSLELRQPTD